MSTKRILYTALALTFVFSIVSGVNFAYAEPNPYDVVFDNFPISVVNYTSPLSTYAQVNSKWNQPRDKGSNPHMGVDLQAGLDTALYAPYDGFVYHDSYGGPNDIKFVVDLNRDGIENDGGYSIRFNHLNEAFPEDEYYEQGDQIGWTGNKSNSGSVGPQGVFLSPCKWYNQPAVW